MNTIFWNLHKQNLLALDTITFYHVFIFVRMNEKVLNILEILSIWYT